MIGIPPIVRALLSMFAKAPRVTAGENRGGHAALPDVAVAKAGLVQHGLQCKGARRPLISDE